MPDLFSGTGRGMSGQSSNLPDLFGGPAMSSSQMPDLFGPAGGSGSRGSPIPDLFGAASSSRGATMTTPPGNFLTCWNKGTQFIMYQTSTNNSTWYRYLSKTRQFGKSMNLWKTTPNHSTRSRVEYSILDKYRRSGVPTRDLSSRHIDGSLSITV